MKKVLMMDDDPLMRELVREMLPPSEFELVLKESGVDGVKFLDSEPKPAKFDLILLDVMMPGMNGFDVLTRLKLHSHTQGIPVIMLTAENKADDIMTGYGIGADYYITKPFTREQLLYGVKLVLQGE